jgi:hypothetical protein
MLGMSDDGKDLDAFGRRAGGMLRASAEELDGATRSRLAQARAAALAQAGRPRQWFTLRQLAPAGALAGAVLVALLLVDRSGPPGDVNDALPAALYDLELLADADAWELSQEADLEFIEWAAAMAELEGAGG